ncbi:sigma factor-like helix-turn-helix DNA-binding protein [soil metagenome]
MTDSAPSIGLILRESAPRVLGILVRRHRQFDACEDATQEALLAASIQWAINGIPDSPVSWLVTVANRRLLDEWRAESARRRREDAVAAEVVPIEVSDEDDTLDLLFLCCHPSLSEPSQVALTLRAVGGLTTAEIAAALLVPEPTMAQRIRRAKQSIRVAGARFGDLSSKERADRLRVVLRVLYLVFNEGYLTSGGDGPLRVDLTDEAIRLSRMLRALLPDEPEVAGLAALLLLTDARRPARTSPDGLPIALADQDRSLWSAPQVAEGIALITGTLGTGAVGPYQLQAAIAAVHDEAATAEDTDWRQILALYDVLARVAPGPIVVLNRAVAVAMVHGPKAGLAELGTLDADSRMEQHHRVHAVRAHLLELSGDNDNAIVSYRAAARLTRNSSEQRYLSIRAARLTP